MLLIYVWVETASGQRGVTQRIDCTADLLLTSLWDETASGTGRSIILVILTLGDLHKDKLNKGLSMDRSSVFLLIVTKSVLSHNDGRSKSAMQSNFCVVPWNPSGSLVPYKSEEQISCAVHSQCCSSLSQRQSRPKQKQGASVPLGPSFPGPGAPMFTRLEHKSNPSLCRNR